MEKKKIEYNATSTTLLLNFFGGPPVIFLMIEMVIFFKCNQMISGVFLV